jgi:hypothetical protein
MKNSQTFTAKFIIPNKNPQYIPNCTIYRNKVVQVYQKGVGESWEEGGMFNGEGDTWTVYEKYVEAYRPYINSTLFQKNNITMDEVKDILEKDQDNAFTDNRIYNCLFELGENPNGYVVINKDEEEERANEKKQEKISNKEEDITFSSGVFGNVITKRLPRNVWEIVKPYGTYHKGNEEDEEWAEDIGYYHMHRSELKGWFYSDEAIKALLDAGYPVTYRGEKILSMGDITKIDNEIAEQEKKYYEAESAYNKKREALISKRRELFYDGDYISEEEAEQAAKLKEVLYPSIGVEGQNIYGGGIWFHITDDALYIVWNNGGDGDDWSRNNYKTGGAGAICVRVEKNKEVNEFLQEVEDFEKMTIKDYILGQS